MAFMEKGHANGAGGATINITNVTAGASLVVAWTQHATDIRTYTVASSVNGAFASVALYAPSRRQGQFRLDNVTAGDHTITVTPNTGTTTVYAWVFEETLGLETGAVTPTGDGITNASATTHFGAPSGEVDSASTATLDIVVCGTFGSSITGSAAGAGYTKATEAANSRNYCQSRSATGPVTDDRGEFTNTGGANASMATMALYQVKDSGGGPTGQAWGRSGMSWWVGL